MPRTAQAITPVIKQLRDYDRNRDKEIRRLTRTLERTLDDLRALNSGGVKVKQRRRRKAKAEAPERQIRVAS